MWRLYLLCMSSKLFALKHILYWVYVYMWYANSFLHPLLPKVIVVLLFVHGLDEIKHSTLVKKGSVLLKLQWYFFVLKRKFILFCSLRLIPITNGHPVGTTFLIQCHTQKSSGSGKIILYSTCTNVRYYGKQLSRVVYLQWGTKVKNK